MALVVKDRVKETSTSTGTGNFTLAGAVAGFQAFSAALANGDTTYYAITDAGTGDFEVGLGTYNAGVLTRTTILESTNAGAAVSFQAGEKEVFITYPAEKAVYADASGNISVPGLVDGRDLAADGSKLDGIEAGATADQTGAEIKSLYEAQANTNAYTDAEKSKLAGIEAGATADQTAAEIKTAYESNANTNAFTDAEQSKLAGIEAGATADQTAAEIKTAYESNANTNAFTDAEKTKLSGIETGATADQTKADIDALGIDAATLGGNNAAYFTGYTDTAVANLVDSAPGTLDTLNELAAALGDDPNFATTVTNNIATKVAKSGDTMTGALNFGDNVKAQFGASADLQIYHDGANSYVKDAGTGVLNVQGSSQVNIGGANGTIGVQFVEGANVTLRHNNSPKLSTTSTGVDVTGNITLSGTVDGVDVAAFKASYDSHNHDDRYYTESEINTKLTDGSVTKFTSTPNDTFGGQYPLVWTASNIPYTSTFLTINGATDTLNVPNINLSGNVHVGGTVDGRDVAADGAKLDGIEAGATADQTITAGAGLTGGGTGDVTISHADTSTQASVNNSGATVIQDVTLDTYGHVTGLASKTLTAADVGALSTSGKAADSNLLDGIDSSQFLRSDASDQYYRISQTPHGNPVNNLGDPSVTEMALFQEQFDNKTAFYDINYLKFYTSTDGTNWTEYTSFSDDNKRKFVGGDYSSGINIPYNTPYFRIEVANAGSYFYLNALYMYWSGSGNTTTVKIRKQRGDGVWSQHTNSTAGVGSWPGHLYLPFNTIPFHPSTTSTGHYRTVHIDFQPTWSTTYTNPISLYRMQLWGGYPAGKRTHFTVDENKQTIFPSEVYANGSTSYKVFHDDYHPNADKLTTARNIALTGAVTGNANFDGSGNISIATTATSDPTLTINGDASGSATFTNLGNATLTLTIADDSHNHVISNVDGLQTALDGKLSTSGKAADSNLLDGLDSTAFFRANTSNSVDARLAAANGRGMRFWDSDNYKIWMSATSDATWGGRLDSTSDYNMYFRMTGGTNRGFVFQNNTTEVFQIESAGQTRQTGIAYVNTNQRVFADDYHPNADKWTTARTLSLSGDASGSVSWDGSANATLSVTVADDSHNHVISNVDGLQAALDGKLSTTGKAADSNLLDGIDSSSFLRSDQSDTINGSLTITTGTGTGTFGSSNTSWFHMTTDRPNFYMNKGLKAAGDVGVYNQNTYLSGANMYLDGVIYHYGDTDTYMQFHALDQWRVVVAGVERLEVNTGGINVNGAIVATGNITAYSDERLKSNIKTIDNALDKVQNLRGVTYDKDGKAGLGVIAQEVQKVLPEVVQEGEEYLSVAYGNIVGVLIEAIKEQQKQIDELKAKIK